MDNHSSFVEPEKGGPIKEFNPNDVLTGRGSSVYSHPGNVLFRKLCLQKWKSCANSHKRSGGKEVSKKILMAEVVAFFRNMNPPGRFLNEEMGHWIEIGDKKAIEKAVSLLRGANLSHEGIINDSSESPRLGVSLSSQSSAQSVRLEKMSIYHQLRNERAFGPTLPTTFDFERTPVDIKQMMTSSIGEWQEDDDSSVNHS